MLLWALSSFYWEKGSLIGMSFPFWGLFLHFNLGHNFLEPTYLMLVANSSCINFNSEFETL